MTAIVPALAAYEARSFEARFSEYAAEFDLRQVASVYFTEEGKEKRKPLQAMRVRVVADGERAVGKQIHILHEGSRREKKCPLVGARAWPLHLAPQAGDAQPTFAGHSVCIRMPESTLGWIVAHPTAADQGRFLDQLCLAGCLVRDLPSQIAFLPEADQPSPLLRLGRPTTSRTQTDAEVVALKVATAEDKMSQLLDEANVLLSLQHPGIVRAYGTYEVRVNDKRSLGMVLDYKAGMDLSYWIPVCGLPEGLARGVLTQVGEALVYLHGLGVVHRDIKPSNVLCDRAKDGSVQVVLADFGLAADITDKDKMSTRCGTGGFVAPEIFQTDWPAQVREDKVTDLTKIDVFSFGMMTYTIIFGKNPFSASTLDGTYLRNARCLLSFEEMGERFSAELQSFLSGICARDPKRRFSSSKACAHLWLSGDGGVPSSGDEGMGPDKVAWAAFEQASYEEGRSATI
jgi:serine/threonine protein kinase